MRSLPLPGRAVVEEHRARGRDATVLSGLAVLGWRFAAGLVAVTLSMVRGRIRGWWPVFAVAVFLVAAFGLLYLVWRSPHRNDLATFGAFAVAMVTLIAGGIAWAWPGRAKTGPPGRPAVDKDPGRLTDLLAMAVQAQWERAAGERGLVAAEPIPVTWGRPSLPLAGPVAAAVGSQRFAPLPGIAPVGEAQLAVGQISDLHAIYGGLGSGRLVIAGGPGSGKSGAAVLLILAALEHRDHIGANDRVKVPVPILFTAQDWDPRRQPVRQWLTRRLRETYPVFAGRAGAEDAARLIDGGKIAVILDGLDEIAEELRPVALQALSQQASFRTIVLSRTAEMASAASQHGVLHGAAAIELHAIDPSTAADYLQRVQLDPPPDGWRDLIDRLRASPRSPLANALSNPLTLTLIRDTYHSGDDARELLDYCDAAQQHGSGAQATEEISRHLLDRVLPSAYAHRPGQPAPRYDLETAQNALEKIAARMNQENTRDLQWWRVPGWAPPAQRIIAGGLAAGLPVGLVAGLVVGLAVGPAAGFAAGLAVGLGTGFQAGFAAYGSKDPPARRGRLRLRRIFRQTNLMTGLAVGLAAGLLNGIAVGLLNGPASGLASGLAAGLAVGLAAGLGAGLTYAFADPDSTTSPSPAAAWQDNRRYAIAVGLLAGLGAALLGGIIFGLLNGPGAGLAIGLTIGLSVGLSVGLTASRVWSSKLATVQLAREWRTPVHLMSFLDDARERNVLRTVGPVYQFRHALVQDRLTARP